MTLPSFVDVGIVAAIAVLVLMIVQYIKQFVPAKVVPWISFPIGVGLAFMFFYKPGVAFNYFIVIVNGLFGAISADTGYNFLSGSKSAPFSLSSKTNGTKPPISQPLTK